MKTHLPSPGLSLLTLAILSLTAGCGSGGGNGGSGSGGSSSVDGSRTESYKYQLSHNGCDTGEKTFASKSAYCAALEDSAQNGYCALEERRDLYQQDCGGDFHEVNAPQPEPAPAPKPEPAPAPTPQPAPPPPEPQGPKAQRDLEAAGFKITVQPENGVHLPGDRPFYERLRDFWDRLETVEDQVIVRKRQFDQIIVTEYGAMNLPSHYVTLSVDMSADDLRSYLAAIDRIAAYQQKAGVTLGVGVIEYRDGHGSDDLNGKLGFLETNGKRVAGAVKEIDFGTSTIYSLYDRKLTLDYDHYQEQFEDLAKVLAPAQPAFQLLDSLGIKLSSTSFIFNASTDSEAAAFAAVTKALGQEKAALTDLSRSGFLEEIESSPGSDENSFYPGLKKLSMANAGAGQRLFHATLGALAEQAKFRKDSGIELDYGYEGLGESFVQASQHLSQVLPLVRAKASLIHKIEFGERSGFEYSVLTVGSADGVAELRKVIAGIQ